MPNTYLNWGLGFVAGTILELLAFVVVVVAIVVWLLVRRRRHRAPSKLDQAGHVIHRDP